MRIHNAVLWYCRLTSWKKALITGKIRYIDGLGVPMLYLYRLQSGIANSSKLKLLRIPKGGISAVSSSSKLT
jgi:hypothetical protein